MPPLAFRKMHGLGNDFVVVDARVRPFRPDAAQARRLADRRRGIGCDQLIILEPPPDPAAGAFMRILNADGSEVAACGNAARCVAALLLDEAGPAAPVAVATAAGVLPARAGAGGWIHVDMGPARLDWAEIPLGRPIDTLHLPLEAGPLRDPVAVGLGNPHAVFLVADAEAVPLEALGPGIEHHPLFPERANVEVCHLVAPDTLRMRVWERGVGITAACGSGACAAAVAAHRRGLAGRRVTVEADGGTLEVLWRADGHVELGGPVATSFTGTVDPDRLG